MLNHILRLKLLTHKQFYSQNENYFLAEWTKIYEKHYKKYFYEGDIKGKLLKSELMYYKGKKITRKSSPKNLRKKLELKLKLLSFKKLGIYSVITVYNDRWRI